MALANDMTLLLNKISRRLGLALLEKHLPKELGREAWAEVIETDTMVTWSRYMPLKMRMVVNDETCDKKIGNHETNSQDRGTNKDQTVWYYIKDSVVDPNRVLGVYDIDWLDYSGDNIGFSGSVGQNMYYPSAPCLEGTFETILGLQSSADVASLYNRGIYIDYEYPGRFSIRGLANTTYDLRSFTVLLLVQHCSLSTISPTKMETYENLAQADVARFLYNNLKYYDGLETAYINLDLKLTELQDIAQTRENVIERLAEANVSMANDMVPAIWGV